MKAFALLAWEPEFEPPNVSGNWETPTSDYCPTVHCAPRAPRAPLPHIEYIHTKWFCKKNTFQKPQNHDVSKLKGIMSCWLLTCTAKFAYSKQLSTDKQPAQLGLQALHPTCQRPASF